MLFSKANMPQIMFLLCSLTWLALKPFHAEAKVVSSFDECSEFFFKDSEPQRIDSKGIKICQMLENGTFFASLHSDYHKIPLYSAYKIDNKCLQTEDASSQMCSRWHIEPQISHRSSEPDQMIQESTSKNFTDKYRRGQSISTDYENTGYDRSHLNPQSFQCSDAHEATFTLTNAVPMDACFNRNHWNKWESYLLKFLKDKLKNDRATIYIVTGAVPGEDRIPQKENCADSREFGRVTVPSHIWTAVCYTHEDDAKSFSFGFIGRNSHEFDIKLMNSLALKEKLGKLYSKGLKTSRTVKIFEGDCFGDQWMSENMISEFLNNIKLPENLEKQMSKDAWDDLLAFQNIISSSNAHENRAKVTRLTATLAFSDMGTFFTQLEALKNEDRSACLLTKISTGSNNQQSVECRLVPEKSVEKKTAADGSPCNYFTDDGRSCTCTTHEGTITLCCSSPCLYQDKLRDYRCYSGNLQIKCSPQYSLVATEGKKCRDDHPCGKYGEDYYWCHTVDDSWEYCSPPLWGSRAKDGKPCRSDHACAKYNKRYTWCYTDDDDVECCPFDDCFSAVNYKTCRPNHPCGYHGKSYLWCYTTDDKWNYCCKECSRMMLLSKK